MRPIPSRRRRGSTLIAALIVSALTAIALVSYLKLAQNALVQADRSFLGLAALNLTEIGLEEAVTTLNRYIGGETAAFADWTVTGSNARRKMSDVAVSSNATGTVRIFIRNYNGTADYATTTARTDCDHDDDHADDHSDDHEEYPGGWFAEPERENADSDDHDSDDHGSSSSASPGPGSSATSTTLTYVVVKATVALRTGGPSVSRYVELVMSRRSYFGLGMVARESISFSGSPSVDSWNSDPDNNPATSPVAYSTSVRAANATVATTATADGAINIGNGDVLGYVRSGGGVVSVGSSGKVHALGTTTHNAARVSTDFAASFPSVVVPVPSRSNTVSSTITATTTFPRGGDSAASDGKYYYQFSSGSGLVLTGGSKKLTVNSPCVFIMDNHSGSTALSISGNASAVIGSSGGLEIYSNGNLDVGGNGMANGGGQPGRFRVMSTGSSVLQTISLVGTSQLGAAVYAPYAAVSIKGGGSSGSFQGAVVGRTITMTGNSNFHYDEALAVGGASNPVRPGRWRELRTAAERDGYATDLDF